MDGDLRLIVKTTVEKDDYRIFLYKSTFFKNKSSIPFILLVSGVMAVILSRLNQVYSLIYFLGAWLFLTLVMFSTIIYKIEKKFRQRIKSDKTGAFDSFETLEFYDDFVIIKSPRFDGLLTIRYEQMYKVIEQKDYFLTYFNESQSSIIRKKDMNLELTNRLRRLYKEKLGENFQEVWY